jgi:hypothetical protein
MLSPYQIVITIAVVPFLAAFLVDYVKRRRAKRQDPVYLDWGKVEETLASLDQSDWHCDYCGAMNPKDLLKCYVCAAPRRC